MENKDKNHIYPFVILDLNQCQKCRGRLELIEEEVSKSKLDRRGIPSNNCESEVVAVLKCMECDEEYDAGKKGAHYFIKGDTKPVKKIMKSFNPFYSR